MATNTMVRRAQAAAQFTLPGVSGFEIAPTFTGGGREMLLAQRARQRGGQRTFGFFSSLGKVLGGVGKAVIAGAANIPIIGAPIQVAQALLAPPPQFQFPQQPLPLSIQGRGFPPPAFVQTGGATAGAGCPPGFKLVRGRCVETGVAGAVQRFLPGGQTGLLADEQGEVVMGGFGIPAQVPSQVGTVARRDGSVSPILRCTAGFVLGRDELCYLKGSIPRSFRKWPPNAKPPISAADWKATKTLGRIQKTVKKVASTAGFTCARKGTTRRK